MPHRSLMQQLSKWPLRHLLPQFQSLVGLNTKEDSVMGTLEPFKIAVQNLIILPPGREIHSFLFYRWTREITEVRWKSIIWFDSSKSQVSTLLWSCFDFRCFRSNLLPTFCLTLSLSSFSSQTMVPNTHELCLEVAHICCFVRGPKLAGILGWICQYFPQNKVTLSTKMGSFSTPCSNGTKLLFKQRTFRQVYWMRYIKRKYTENKCLLFPVTYCIPAEQTFSSSPATVSSFPGCHRFISPLWTSALKLREVFFSSHGIYALCFYSIPPSPSKDSFPWPSPSNSFPQAEPRRSTQEKHNPLLFSSLFSSPVEQSGK